MTREGEIKGIDDHGIRDDGGVCILCSGIQVILLRKSIHGPHLCFRGYFPDNVEILEKEGPVSLATREFVRIFKIRQMLMVGENRDRMGGALQILFAFCQGKDDSEKFPIIDVIVALHSGEGLGEVSARVEVTRGIRLHQDYTSGKKRGVCHEQKGRETSGMQRMRAEEKMVHRESKAFC